LSTTKILVNTLLIEVYLFDTHLAISVKDDKPNICICWIGTGFIDSKRYIATTVKRSIYHISHATKLHISRIRKRVGHLCIYDKIIPLDD
jgi:hypothetical protein